MSRKLVIDPITRIEGHGKVVITLDDQHRVADAKLHVVEFRGFEKFIQGHPYWEAPMLLQRICGICFVSHHLAGAKALDDMVGVGYATGASIPAAAEKVRRLGHYAQQLQSHVTAYFYLVVPEMLFGIDAPPEQRNVLGLIEKDPALVRRVVALRKWGQELITALLGKRMHGISAVPGGVNAGLSLAQRDRFLRGEEGLLSLPEVMEYARDGLQVFEQFHGEHRDEVDQFADVPALNMCLVDESGNADYYHGHLRVTDSAGDIVSDFDYHDYLDHLAEATEEWSYMKFPFLKALDRETGSVRVGPLARINNTRSYDTPLAQAALEAFRAYNGSSPCNRVLHTLWARAIEIVHTAELIEALLHDPDLQGETLVATPPAGAWTGEGVGVIEAPRGTLLHHYRASEDGRMTFANLIVATTQNNAVLNRTVRAVAERCLGGRAEITEGMMNEIEVGIRAYDPCLSCATHALGQMPLTVVLQDASGRCLHERSR